MEEEIQLHVNFDQDDLERRSRRRVGRSIAIALHIAFAHGLRTGQRWPHELGRKEKKDFLGLGVRDA